jgi:hypothetical protein
MARGLAGGPGRHLVRNPSVVSAGPMEGLNEVRRACVGRLAPPAGDPEIVGEAGARSADPRPASPALGVRVAVKPNDCFETPGTGRGSAPIPVAAL